MDSKNFRKVSNPNLYASYKEVKPNIPDFVLPNSFAPDNRYKNWPAIMEDARLTTNYMNHCSQNIPVGEQFPTKHFLQNNAEKVIDYSRKYQMPFTRSLDKSVLPPPAQVVECSRAKCQLTNTNSYLGIGVERLDNKTPYLFGTFIEPSQASQPKNSHLTHYYEGGRNTPSSKRALEYNVRFNNTYNNLNNPIF